MKSVSQSLRWFPTCLLSASVVFACALMGSTSIAQTATPEKLPTPIFTRNVSFGIPYTIPPAKTSAEQPVEVRLFVATQNAKGWQIADSKKLESTTQGVRGQFTYQAPADGEFWFAIRTVDRAGQLRGGKSGPELRVIVDTQQPTIRLNAERNASGAITLRWEIADPTLVPDSLVMSYQVAGRPDWRTVAIDKGRATGAAKPIVGTATFWPDAATGDLQVRAEVRDRAGNNGMSQVTVTGKAGALANNGTLPTPNPVTNPAATTINPPLSNPSATGDRNLASSRNPSSPSNDPPPQFPFATPTPTSTPNSKPIANPFGQPAATKADITPATESNSPQSVLRPSADAPTAQGNGVANPPAQPLNGMRLAPADDGPNLFAPLNSRPTNSGANASGSPNPTTNERPAQQNPNLTPPASIDFLPPAGSANGSGYNPSGSSLAQQGLPPSSANSLASPQNSTSSAQSSNPQNSTLAPRVESRVVAPNTQTPSTTTTDSKLTKLIDYRLANGKLPTMVNSRTFEWEYEIDQMPSSGIAQVELWITQDGGKSWQSAGIDADKRSPIRTQVEGEGVFGYRITVQGNGASNPRSPQSGEQPEMWIGVDLTKPVAKLLNAELAVTGNTTGDIGITWNASDTLLAAKPVRLLFSDQPNGQWKPIAEGLENSGRYTWHYDEKTPDKVYVRLEVSDIAGNVSVSESLEPIELGRYQAEGRLRGVKPIGESSSLVIPLDRALNANLQRPVFSQTVQSLISAQTPLSPSNPASSQAEILFESGNVKMIGNPYLSKKTPDQPDSKYR